MELHYFLEGSGYELFQVVLFFREDFEEILCNEFVLVEGELLELVLNEFLSYLNIALVQSISHWRHLSLNLGVELVWLVL